MREEYYLGYYDYYRRGIYSVGGVQWTIYPIQRKIGMATKKVTSEPSCKLYRPQRLNLEKGRYFNIIEFAS